MELTFSVYSTKYSQTTDINYFLEPKPGFLEAVNYDDLLKNVEIFPPFLNFYLKSRSTKNTIMTQKKHRLFTISIKLYVKNCFKCTEKCLKLSNVNRFTV